MIDELRDIALFAGLSDEQLQWIGAHSREVSVGAGDILFSEGNEADAFYILLAGELQMTANVEGSDTVLATHERGAFTGEVPLLIGGPYIATARALQPSRVLRFARPDFEALLSVCPPVAHVMLPMLARRIQNTQGVMQQRSRLAALGRLSAGLAHEMNNPAAAAARAANQLRAALDVVQSLTLKLCTMQLNGEQLTALDELRRTAASATPPELDPIARSDREEELISWLDDHKVADSCDLAPNLVATGLDSARLNALASVMPQAALCDALTWLGAALDADALVNTIENSVSRLSDLVKSVKAYSYMDQAPVQEVDIHEGLDNTLTILGFKLKGITVTREYDRSLPRISAHGSELNQVWTNLLDNAAAALGGKGRIWVRTCRENDHAVVEIADDGPGIAPETQARIFEPFFTTKAVGEGSGLGLSTVHNIVVGQHRGDISVESKPGNTVFRVRLPLEKVEGGR